MGFSFMPKRDFSRCLCATICIHFFQPRPLPRSGPGERLNAVAGGGEHRDPTCPEGRDKPVARHLIRASA